MKKIILTVVFMTICSSCVFAIMPEPRQIGDPCNENGNNGNWYRETTYNNNQSDQNWDLKGEGEAHAKYEPIRKAEVGGSIKGSGGYESKSSDRNGTETEKWKCDTSSQISDGWK